MRAIALKREFGDIGILFIVVEANDNATEDEKKVLTSRIVTYTFVFETFDEGSGIFGSTDSNHNGKEQVIIKENSPETRPVSRLTTPSATRADCA